MAMMMFLFACMALGAALLSALFFLDARRRSQRRRPAWTNLMYLASALSALAAVGLAYLSYLVLDALLTIF